MFEPEQVYKRSAIHHQFGGQVQGGISTPKSVPFIFLFTSSSGEAHGYDDGWLPSGRFRFSGEGQRGDQEFIRGNKSIRDHEQMDKKLLLFEKTAKSNYRFVGEFRYVNHSLVTARDTHGAKREMISFELEPA
jgi:5-methylcytosine-specific restriction protein A